VKHTTSLRERAAGLILLLGMILSLAFNVTVLGYPVAVLAGTTFLCGCGVIVVRRLRVWFGQEPSPTQVGTTDWILGGFLLFGALMAIRLQFSIGDISAWPILALMAIAGMVTVGSRYARRNYPEVYAKLGGARP
jgi:hypothetical protein